MVQSSSLSVAVLCFSFVKVVLSKTLPIAEVVSSHHKNNPEIARIHVEEEQKLDHRFIAKYRQISIPAEHEKINGREDKAISKVFGSDNFFHKQVTAPPPAEESSGIIGRNLHDNDEHRGPDDITRRRTLHFLESGMNERRSQLETVRRNKLNSQSKMNHLAHANSIQH